MAVYSQALTTENVLELVHFEDLPLGGEWRTRRRTITAADLAAFVGLSGDYNPLYTDAEHARGGHFGETVVPGALVVAVTTGLGAIDVPLPATVGMVGMTWKFIRPVRPGDTIRSLWRLNRKRPVENPRWGLAVWQVEVENQKGELVAAAELTRLVSRREQPAEAGRLGKAARRRRRRAGAEAGVPGAASELPPKPMPGPLREPLSRPVPEPAPAPAEAPAAEIEAPAPSAEAPAEQAPGRRRRRSTSRAKPEQAPETAAAAVEVPAPPVEEALPAAEPAAEPKPAPRRRRRARQPEQPPEAPPPESAPPGAPPPEARAPEGPTADPAPSSPAPPPDPAAIPSPFRPPDASAPRDDEGPDGGSGGLAGVLRRLRGT